MFLLVEILQNHNVDSQSLGAEIPLFSFTILQASALNPGPSASLSMSDSPLDLFYLYNFHLLEQGTAGSGENVLRK